MVEQLYPGTPWRASGVCRTVCRPVRNKRRCFNAKKVQSVIDYAIRCGETREHINDVIGCVGCHDILDVLTRVQQVKASAEEEIRQLETILEAFAVLAAVLRLVPTWIRRFPIIRRLFFAIEALLAFADVLSNAIKALLDALIDIETLIAELAEEICNAENGES